MPIKYQNCNNKDIKMTNIYFKISGRSPSRFLNDTAGNFMLLAWVRIRGPKQRSRKAKSSALDTFILYYLIQTFTLLGNT